MRWHVTLLNSRNPEDDVTPSPVWPVLPLQEQLAPWLPMFIGLAIAVAFVIVVVDSVERL
jgi:hypothetical protein